MHLCVRPGSRARQYKFRRTSALPRRKIASSPNHQFQLIDVGEPTYCSISAHELICVIYVMRRLRRRECRFGLTALLNIPPRSDRDGSGHPLDIERSDFGDALVAQERHRPLSVI